MPTIRSRFIQKALDSVLNQTLTDWELIVLNGCPLRQVVVPVDDRITVVDIFGLPTELINVGVGMASSDIILLVSDDDEDLPTRAEEIYKEIEGGADIFCGCCFLINEKSEVIGEERIEFDINEDAVLTQGPPSLKAGGYRKSTCPKWTNEFHFLSDYVFFMESYKKGLNIKIVKTLLSKSRDWPGNLSSAAVMSTQAKRSETFRLRKMYGPTARCRVSNSVMHLPLEAFE